MQLRRFTSDSAAGALRAVREALGDEAVILSNRQVDGRTEIIATGTYDEQALAASVAPESPAVAPAAASPDEDDAATTASTLESLSRDLAEMSGEERPLTLGAVPATGVHEIACEASGDEPENTPGRGADPAARAATNEDVAPTAAPAATDASAALARRESAPSAFRDEPVGAATVAAIGQVLANAERRHAERARRLERRFQRLEVNLWGELEPLRAAHLRQLVRFGIGAELAVRLVERLEPGMTAGQAMRQSLALLKATLPLGSDETGRRPGVTVLHGIAGGGKTTALVKLAAGQVRRAGAQSVALISAGDRIGAFATLQAYGRLLGVPVVQARDTAELEEQLAVLAHKPLLLVDHLPLERADAVRLPRAETLGHVAGEARTLRRLLVLPATLEPRLFEAQVALHRAHGVSHGVLTRVDQATRLAACFGPLVRHALPLAYVSEDARVQTPLDKADAARLVAVAMTAGNRERPGKDEEILLNLLQPTRREIARVADEDGKSDPATDDASHADAGTRGVGTPSITSTSPATTPRAAGTLERIVSFEALDEDRVLGGDDLLDVIETRETIERAPSAAEPAETPAHATLTADWKAWEHAGKSDRDRADNRKRKERR